MTYKPMNDRRIVEDDVSGVRVKVRSTGADITALRVRADGLTLHPLEFTIRRYPNDGSVSGASKPTLEIQVGGIETMLRLAGLHNFECNTKIVRAIIEGICEFNRNWPQSSPPILFSDKDEAISKGIKLSFSLPSNDELIALSR